MQSEVENMKNKLTKLGLFLNKNASKIMVTAMITTMMFSTIVFGATADSLWTTISGLIQTWVTRLGAVVVFVGGIMFALGWKSDDAEQKSRGISTIIAGAIVMAIAALTGTFFA